LSSLSSATARRLQQLGLDDHRSRADGVHVALIELTEAPLLRAVGPPDRLHLVALEESRQLRAVLGHDPRKGNGEVVAERQVGLAGVCTFAALENLEDELVALFAVLPEQRLDVLHRRRLEGLEAVLLVDPGDHADDVLAAADILGQEIAHPARGAGVHDW